MIQMKWHSYHIFIHDLTYHDLFLTDYLYPFIQEYKDLIYRYFFIRYWQGGPHIRFRFQTLDSEKIIVNLQALVNEFQVIYKPTYTLSRDEYYRNHTFDGRKPKESELYWMEDLTVSKMKYIPEYERYGGESLIPFSEAIFQMTSHLAFIRLKEQRGNPSLTRKLIFACEFFDQMRSFLQEEQDVYLLENYEQFWKSFQRKGQVKEEQIHKIGLLYRENREIFSERLEQQEDNHLQKIKEIFQEIRKRGKEKIIPHLIFSHVHMYNNRIGLPPYLESSVATIMKSTKQGVNEY